MFSLIKQLPKVLPSLPTNKAVGLCGSKLACAGAACLPCGKGAAGRLFHSYEKPFMREFLKLSSTEFATQSVSVGVGLKSAPILMSSKPCELSYVDPKGQRSRELLRNSVVDSKLEPDGKTSLSNASFNEKDQATIAKYIERIKNDLTQALKELQAPVEFNKGIFFNRSLSLVALNDESKAILAEFSKIFEGAWYG